MKLLKWFVVLIVVALGYWFAVVPFVAEFAPEPIFVRFVLGDFVFDPPIAVSIVCPLAFLGWSAWWFSGNDTFRPDSGARKGP
ncbi:MAG TPA: hypothetical protein VNP98_17445 [Chthoniobacterales bacterium]|nr:hypothetical protein [Chthoniobacterales bacterium]